MGWAVGIVRWQAVAFCDGLKGRPECSPAVRRANHGARAVQKWHSRARYLSAVS